MCDLADGFNDITRVSRVKARKWHECVACHEVIGPGHVYINGSALYDGHWSSWKHCLRCDQIFRSISAESEDPVAIDIGLDCGETWESAFGVKPPLNVAALAFWLPKDGAPCAS